MGNTEKEVIKSEEEYFIPRKKLQRKYYSKNSAKREVVKTLQEGAKYVVEGGQLVLVEAPKNLKPLQIVSNETYKSRDGRKIKIFVVNKDSIDFPIIGVIDEDGIWKPLVWNKAGLAKRPYGAGNDVISLWSET